jgi:hypothetical protein
MKFVALKNNVVKMGIVANLEKFVNAKCVIAIIVLK